MDNDNKILLTTVSVLLGLTVFFVFVAGRMKRQEQLWQQWAGEHCAIQAERNHKGTPEFTYLCDDGKVYVR